MYIPNRTLSNVIVYPRGYVRCFADVSVSSDTAVAAQMVEKIKAVTQGFLQQYPGIARSQPELTAIVTTPVGRKYLRVKFRIWPSRSVPIEGAYKNEIVQTLRTLDDSYADWMVNIATEISESPKAIAPFRRKTRAKKGAP